MDQFLLCYMMESKIPLCGPILVIKSCIGLHPVIILEIYDHIRQEHDKESTKKCDEENILTNLERLLAD